MEHIHIVISEINIDDRPDIEVKSVLESIIEQIINESPKRKQEPEDENSVTKKAKTNLIQEQSSFSMGVCCGGYTKRRKLNRKSKKPTINRPRQPQIINNHKIIMEMVLKKEVELTSLFNNVNPFVLRLNVYKKAREIVEPKYDFSGKKYALIKIIIPVLKPDLLTYKLAYYNISPIAGDLFHWQVKLNEISRIKTLAQLTEFKPICEKQSFFPNKYFIIASKLIFNKNQRVRWQLKRLVSAWLRRKSIKRIIGKDNDLETLEAIPDNEEIKILCLRTRSTYVFSGKSLIKAINSNLGFQIASISTIKLPTNPFTNEPFTYCQLLHICYEISGWCYKHKQPYPTLLSFFRESNFNPNRTQNLHYNYLQYNSTQAYIMGQEGYSEFFFENLEVLFDEYGIYLRPYNKHLDSELYREWGIDEPDSYLLKNWKQLVCDYWHYKQTDHLIREHWRSKMSILYDMEILLKSSESSLKNYVYI